MTPRPGSLGLSASTVLPASAEEAVIAAAHAGFNQIGIRMLPVAAGGQVQVSPDDRPRMTHLAAMLRYEGITVLDVEALWLTPDTKPMNYDAAFDAMAYLGARYILVVSGDDNLERTAENVAEVARLCLPRSIRPAFEFSPVTAVKTLKEARAVVEQSGVPEVGVIVDPLNLSRSGGSPSDLKDIPAGRLAYLQICDAPAAKPDTIDGLRQETSTGRLLPGDGALPLREFLSYLPPGAPLTVEAQGIGGSTEQRAQAAMRALRKLLV